MAEFYSAGSEIIPPLPWSVFAPPLTTTTGMSIADIAASLGYEEHANFTRAFGRWQHCSPSEFRKMNRQDPL